MVLGTDCVSLGQHHELDLAESSDTEPDEQQFMVENEEEKPAHKETAGKTDFVVQGDDEQAIDGRHTRGTSGE